MARTSHLQGSFIEHAYVLSVYWQSPKAENKEGAHDFLSSLLGLPSISAQQNNVRGSLEAKGTRLSLCYFGETYPDG